MDKTVYQENGFSNRDEHLSDLADQYGVPKHVVYSISEMLGENEDFDGLISTLEDYSLIF